MLKFFRDFVYVFMSGLFFIIAAILFVVIYIGLYFLVALLPTCTIALIDTFIDTPLDMSFLSLWSTATIVTFIVSMITAGSTIIKIFEEL